MPSVPKTGSGKTQRKVLKGMAVAIKKARMAPKAPVVTVFEFDSDEDLSD